MRPWTVLPHDPIAKLEPDLWCVAGSTPMPLNRRAMIVRLSSGRLVFLNAMPLEEPAQQEVEGWGEPAFLVVPNGFHRLDVAAWKQRYPRAKVLAPAAHRAKVAERVAVDGAFELLPGGEGIERVPVEGLKIDEGVFFAGRSLLVPGDLIFNVPHGPLLLRLMGSSGGPKVTPLGRLMLVADRAKVAASLRAVASRPDLARVIPCHGDIIDAEPAVALRRIADKLDRS
jgi:hypothetical protein